MEATATVSTNFGTETRTEHMTGRELTESKTERTTYTVPANSSVWLWQVVVDVGGHMVRLPHTAITATNNPPASQPVQAFNLALLKYPKQ